MNCSAALLQQFKHNFYSQYQDQLYIIILDSNGYDQDIYSSYDLMMAAASQSISYTPGMALSQLERESKKGNWLFGYLGYDVKNEIHPLQSVHEDYTCFNEYSFFVPDVLVRIKGNHINIDCKRDAPHSVFERLMHPVVIENKLTITATEVKHRTSRNKYLQTVRTILNDIYEGHYYELNYCQEFFIEHLQAEPFRLFEQMNQQTQMPFSAFYKNREQYILSFSPERFLKKQGNKLISQPMKGTARRDLKDIFHDQQLKEQLMNSEKERAENLMIVDLVRNDLTRTSVSGTIRVEELCAVYAFPGVHQMISTITAETVQNNVVEIIRHTFPMGSMTGAPKLEVMRRIDELEDTRRGAYSGCLGYIAPKGDFDFNVLIRTLCYNTKTGYASYHTGSAITYDSIPEEEYEECLLKAQTFFSLMNRKA